MVTIHGRQVSLGVTDPNAEEAAVAAFRRMLAGDAGPTGRPALPAAAAVDRYLERVEVAPNCKHIYHQYLRRFVGVVGPHRDLHTLTAGEVESTAVATWAPSTKHGYIGCLGVFLRSVGVTLDRKLKRPQKESRGASAVWTEEEYWRILGAARGDFRAVVQLLWLTGARPSEVVSLTVESVDWKHGTATLARHKNAGKGKSRVLHFPESAMSILRAQREKHTTGHLFRQGQGARHPEKPMTMKGLGARMVNARRRAGIGRNVHLYGLRHTAATRALERGFSAEQVAALIGNSAGIVLKHYGHVGANADLMKRIAESLAN